jgi:ATP-dependent RNA helicase DeaD
MTTFEQLGITKSILDGLKEIGFSEAFPIQVATIPVLLSGRDVVGQAHTGTGKTAAYSISMLQGITPRKKIQGIVIAPTRELAIQITEEIRKFAKYTGIKVATVYGGQGMGLQLDALRRGVEIVVATPGRIIDHLKRGSIRLDDVKYVVLDEADTMLDMGFIEDIEFILDLTPKDKVMSLFSATMPPEILRLAENYLNNPKQFLLDADDLSGEGIDQSYLVIKDREKMKYLLQFINENKRGQTIVFCSTKNRTRDVARELYRERYNAVAIEGDMSQHQREQSMGKFRTGKADILVATDVAARGIDVPEVALVVNYDVPNQELVYFHRIGRTARAGAKGRAITFVSYSSIGDWNLIKRQTKVQMTDLNEKMGIVVSIPDPLKREIRPRSFGYHNKTRFSDRQGGRRDRHSGGRRDKHDGGRDRHQRYSDKKSYYGLRSRW